MPTLSKRGEIHVLDLGDDENRFNDDWVSAVEAALDAVVAAPGPTALVTTGSGKFWSNGLDLDWMRNSEVDVPAFIGRVHRLFARVLALPVPSVAAIKGHCVAAGAMLAIAHDQRIMRADRGYFWLPEVDIRVPFTPAMAALLQARLPRSTAHEAMVIGRRYGGTDAVVAKIVDAAVGPDDVLSSSMTRAGALVGKDAETMRAIKETMYADTLRLLRDPAPVAFSF